MAKVEFRHVVKRFGDVEVIPDLNLTIEDGEFVALLGPSGCGKSTSLFILAGIYLPSGGELLFDGRVVNEVEAKDRNVGIVFQSYALYPHMTVRDNVLFPLRFKRMPREEALARVVAAANLVQVTELLDRRPSELSGGQQQRVALARADVPLLLAYKGRKVTLYGYLGGQISAPINCARTHEKGLIRPGVKRVARRKEQAAAKKAASM
jgi:inositol-phosphate transport system ATP-binding protein